MQDAANELSYEQAAVYRDQMRALAAVLHQQTMEAQNPIDADVLVVEQQGNQFCVNLAMIRAGRHLGDRAFFPRQAEQESPNEEIGRASCRERERSGGAGDA